MCLPTFVCLSVCLLAKLLKNGWCIWMKCCVSTDVGTWTNWLNFEPDQDYSPDAGTGLLSPISYKRCYAEFYVRKIPRIRINAARAAARRNFKIVLFTQPSKHLCRRYMRSIECPSSSHCSFLDVFYLTALFFTLTIVCPVKPTF